MAGCLRSALAGAALLIAGFVARPAAAGQAEDVEEALAHASRPELPRVSAGMRAGIMLPALTLPEVTFGLANQAKTGPQVTFSLVGAVLPAGWGFGDNGGLQTTVGSFLNFETRDVSGGYVSLGYAYYHAAADSNGFWETDQIGYLTFGWLRRGENTDFFIGGGLVAILSEEHPCTGWCIDVDIPPVLPTFDVGFRFHTTSRVRRDEGPRALLDQLAQLRVDDDVAAAGELDLLEERVVVRVADLDAVEAGADVFAVALPVPHLPDQHVVDPDGGVGDVALDAEGDGVGVQRVRTEDAVSMNERRQREQRRERCDGPCFMDCSPARAPGPRRAGARGRESCPPRSARRSM